jgi:hypothetical protein
LLSVHLEKSLRKDRQLLIIAFLFSAASAVRADSEMGLRVANGAMSLIGFSEMANIAARDQQCRGTYFPVADINALIEKEIVPLVTALQRVDRSAKKETANDMIAMLKQLPDQRDGRKTVLQKVYEQKKEEAVAAYGPQNACASVSTMLLTVIHQKRAELQEVGHALGVGR